MKALKPAAPGKRYIVYDAQIPGFGIRVTDRCTKDNKGAFVLVTRFPGSANPVPRRIGGYPAMTLAKSREVAREWREDLRQGADPKVKEAERRREQERRRADTFAAVFATFADDHLSTLRTGGDVTKAFANHVFPRWGERPISAIRRADVNELVRAVRKDGPIMANRVLAYLKKFFAWTIDQEMIDASPAASVKRPTKESKRDRVLSEQEIAAIWQACDGLGAFGRAFRLMLVTGGIGQADERESSSIGARARLRRVPMVADWRLHDLRRTCATHLAQCGVDRIVIGKILNHAENEVTAIYDRHRYDREKRAALDRWGERLAGRRGRLQVRGRCYCFVQSNSTLNLSGPPWR